MMNPTLRTNKPLTYLGVDSFKSKSGDVYNVVVLGDREKCENYRFFVPDNFDYGNSVKNSLVIPTFELSKYNNNVDFRLVSLESVQVKEPVK